MKMHLAAMATVVSTALPAMAQDNVNYLPKNGNDLVDLLNNCQSEACMSYVSGVINGIGVYAYVTERPSPFCTDQSVSSEDIRDAIVTVVEDTPRLGHINAPAAILAAFSRNWPCVENSAEAVTTNIDDVDEVDDLVTYADLQQVDMDTLLDFVSKGTYSNSFGKQDAPLEKTLHVFDDPNCEYCDVFSEEMKTLIDQDWRIIIYPISTISAETDPALAEASKSYAALQYALRIEHPEAADNLFWFSSDAIKDTNAAMDVAGETGTSPAAVFEALGKTNPYVAVEANNKAFADLGALSAPTWILGDRISSGIFDADEIIRIQGTLSASPQRGLIRPGVQGE